MRASGTHASELEMRHKNVKVSSMDRKLSKDVKLILENRMQKNKGKEDTMASSMIHLAIVQEMRKEISFRDINPPVSLGWFCQMGRWPGNSHLKKKICENTRYTYDLEFFRDRYGKYMEKDDLYLGYYLHLIQDMLYRRFMYGEHGWNSSVPGNVEKLHRDYEILNEYVSKKYGLFQEMIQELDLTEDPLAQLAEFDVKDLIEEVRGEFVQRKEEKLSILTRQMADEYIVRATEFCVEELKALSKGKSGLDSTVWSWEKPENISHGKLNQKLNAKIENM